MTDTLAYYNANAERFFAETCGVDMSALHERFLARIPAGGWILDAGCGSGRDIKAFCERGYRVSAFDGSQALARLAEAHAGVPVAVRTFDEVSEEGRYDGIWACASLLHLPRAAMADAVERLWRALRPGGTLYMSFKQGQGERVHAGRLFADADEPYLRGLIAPLPEVADTALWRTDDARPDRLQVWLNALVTRAAAPRDRLVTGGDDPFLPHLRAAMSGASEIDLAVAFIKTTGLRLLLPDLHMALAPEADAGIPAARVRILTSDYLDVTDPEALRLLLLLQEQGAQVRIYESARTGFHLKAYIFSRHGETGGVLGTAFIGSSNISRQALQSGLEWNYRVDYPGEAGFLESRSRFEELFASPDAVKLTDAWIRSYEARRSPMTRAVAPGSEEREPPPEPSAIQSEALAALAATRQEGYRRGLVVLPTGLGKTWLAAFDTVQAEAERVLFVAHREEILSQAAETFLRIVPQARVGFYAGAHRDEEADVLCASVQTLGRQSHLDRFARDHFDYIVVDEFHHASAATYRRLLGHFNPRFLLGLTATPDRTDQADIASLCDGNVVYTCGLMQGIADGLLIPFHYYGIFDETVDYQSVPWRNGRFDPEALSNKLATLARARHALTEWQRRRQARTLGFCVSIRHARFMADQFRAAGVSAEAVYAGSPVSRGDALDRLRDGQLEVLFCVDLFNEGVDLPSIDTVMMLRPTESKILFLQQLGRGLRRAPGKERLVVLDFIGNHSSFLHKPQALFGTGARYGDLARFARQIEAQRFELPPGCYVNYDLSLIQFLKALEGLSPASEYQAMREATGRRPTLTEFYRAGTGLERMRQVRQAHGSWFGLAEEMGDLDDAESVVAAAHGAFLAEVESTPMSKSFKMVLLEAFAELDGWKDPPTLAVLSARSWDVLQRRRTLLADLPERMLALKDGRSSQWQRYWAENPINAWTGGNRKRQAEPWFRIDGERFVPTFAVDESERETLASLVQEVLDYRLDSYQSRKGIAAMAAGVSAAEESTAPEPVDAADDLTPIPFFPNLRIACGHFKTGRADAATYRSVRAGFGKLDPARHFIACASGNSMNGGKHPIVDGDYLLLEHLSPTSAGSITGSVMAIERRDETGDDQYLLRVVTKSRDGRYILKANNPAYADLEATEEMRTLARLKAVLSPEDLV